MLEMHQDTNGWLSIYQRRLFILLVASTISVYSQGWSDRDVEIAPEVEQLFLNIS